ncbi:hypothetical protein FKM82_026582 [Ascaphus truei]
MPLRLVHPRQTLLARRHQPWIHQRQSRCPRLRGASQCPGHLPRLMRRHHWRWGASPIWQAATGAVQPPNDPGPVTQVHKPQDQVSMKMQHWKVMRMMLMVMLVMGGQ